MDSRTSLKAKAKDFKIVLDDPRGRELVLEVSNTGTKCFGEAPNTLHIYSVIDNGQNSKLLPLKSFLQNIQWLVKSVSSSFSKDLSHEAKAKTKDSTLKTKAKTKDYKIVLADLRGRGLVLEDSITLLEGMSPTTHGVADLKQSY